MGRATRDLLEVLEQRGAKVIDSVDCGDAESLIISEPSIDCLILDWDMGGDEEHALAQALVFHTRSRNETMPIFLMAERQDASSIPLEVMERVDDYIWLMEDTTRFVAGRVEAAIERYRAQLFPPFTKALAEFSQVYEYSWHTPGHTGGTAFLKSPVGKAFHDAYGEPMFRTDLSISVGELGSLLDHSGPIGQSEEYAARVFGADRSYTVTNGTSTSNRMIWMACVSSNEIALVDRNCHKSSEHGLTLTGAVPVYLMPSRNHLGLIGPVHPDVLDPKAVKKQISKSGLKGQAVSDKAVYAILTNSTYDGLCYNVERVKELLGKSVDRLHFDEAWYGYARFNPLYHGRYAMTGSPEGYDGPTLFSTQSTHKLLAALSQASFIHMRDGRRPIPHALFNESFMMHSSTSPLYSIIASNEISAAMMDGAGGLTLTTEAIQEAVAFRQDIATINCRLEDEGEWFFTCFQPREVRDDDGGKIPFHLADEDRLVHDPDCWVLHPEDEWHGFKDLEDGFCMLDPIKVSVVTPGMGLDGLESWGIPACIVTSYLDGKGIVVEKTTDFTILFLFSIGVTKGKWGTLVNALLSFKRDYDHNTPLKECLPSLVASYPKRYKGMGLKDLCDAMFARVKKGGQMKSMAEAYGSFPPQSMTPGEAYRKLVHGEVERIKVDDLGGRTVATGVVPYPPGIPLLMPGELVEKKSSYLAYLKALQAFDREFPGFGHDIHGIEAEDGDYMLYVLKG
jgi:arginine/lysine/ornithine decarboxylase